VPPSPDPRPLPDRPARRQDLEAPYRRPFRLVAAGTWRAQGRLRRDSYVALAVIAAGAIGAVTVSPVLWILAGAGAMVGAFALVGWTAAVLRESWRLRRAWGQKSELRSVLHARPHAGTEDPELAHDLFAVTAEDDGWLLTWRFRPLRVGEHVDEETEVEVPGRPRHAARVVTERRFDAHDAALAAEQLVAAQEDAAAREARAAAAVHGGIEDADRRAELAIEARTTAAALRRATGQDARRR
jgi:hypothetical protein